VEAPGDVVSLTVACYQGEPLGGRSGLWSDWGLMTFHETASRLWKSLPPGERLLAAAAFFRDPSPELVPEALQALVKARHMRPQAARALPPDAQARILATVLNPGESLAHGLLVDLHLVERRPLLAAFLDALGLPHDDGILSEEAESGAPVSPEAAREAVASLASFPPEQVHTYLNTLWLQDEERWGALAEADSGPSRD
jgi:hypothetical protein